MHARTPGPARRDAHGGAQPDFTVKAANVKAAAQLAAAGPAAWRHSWGQDRQGSVLSRPLQALGSRQLLLGVRRLLVGGTDIQRSGATSSSCSGRGEMGPSPGPAGVSMHKAAPGEARPGCPRGPTGRAGPSSGCSRRGPSPGHQPPPPLPPLAWRDSCPAGLPGDRSFRGKHWCS